ncbi:ComEA family DNA-binding protein [Streptomyces sp. NBC_01481]|uniref:ComEA family DNA-binding protein n=1 Tax=Streptomyces sp. NBC_01481 TaxID=2975869 RepID=UPI002258BAED|nr:ComEA family DNA-binding protein [Streptomyces sp. NBC_01481]MCX4582188.1 ComEA family DNA-binding protein [Streptomyces sp. NBC_01481]
MALRTRSARSGPGRARASDGRARDGRVADGRARDFGLRSGPGRGMYRPGRRPAPLRGGRVAAASITAPRRRADALFDGSPGGTGPAEPPGARLDAADGRSRAEGRAVAAADVDVGADVDFGTSARQRMRLAVRERLPLWLQLRCGLEPRALAALAVVLVLAAGFAVQHFWVGRPQTVRAPELVQQGAATPESPPSPGPPPPDPGAGGGRIVIVDVSGKVRRPGVHRLPAGSRVADALRAAGGVRAGTDLTGLNRARVLMDGEQVVVGVAVRPGLPATGSGPGASGPAGAQPAGPVSLNSATVEELDTLPGVGPVLAQHIVDYRTQHGGFRSVDELREVNGIGDRRFADLQTLVRP